MLCKLPVSGHEVSLELPKGWEDVLLSEWRGGSAALAHRLLDSVTRKDAVQGIIDWGEMPITDIEWALLLLRRSLFGDVIMGNMVCQHPECGAKIDVSFRISDYLGHFQATLPQTVEESKPLGWFALADTGIRFRLPTGNDQRAVSNATDPAGELKKRCNLAASLPEALLEQVEASLEAMAPVISGVVGGKCPECNLAGEFYFDVQAYVLQELIDQAKFVFDDVHLLASHYRWTEEVILNLPRQRRFRYVEAITRDRSTA